MTYYRIMGKNNCKYFIYQIQYCTAHETPKKFEKNLEIDKIREKCVNFNFQKKKKGKRHKTQVKK